MSGTALAHHALSQEKREQIVELLIDDAVNLETVMQRYGLREDQVEDLMEEAGYVRGSRFKPWRRS